MDFYWTALSRRVSFECSLRGLLQQLTCRQSTGTIQLRGTTAVVPLTVGDYKLDVQKLKVPLQWYLRTRVIVMRVFFATSDLDDDYEVLGKPLPTAVGSLIIYSPATVNNFTRYMSTHLAVTYYMSIRQHYSVTCPVLAEKKNKQ